MDNPETLATLDEQETRRRQKKNTKNTIWAELLWKHFGCSICKI